MKESVFADGSLKVSTRQPTCWQVVADSAKSKSAPHSLTHSPTTTQNNYNQLVLQLFKSSKKNENVIVLLPQGTCSTCPIADLQSPLRP